MEISNDSFKNVAKICKMEETIKKSLIKQRKLLVQQITETENWLRILKTKKEYLGKKISGKRN
ncbi:hypothetical protein GF322_00535 [Candidatus Dependentiae bacterium]|nr:hypothetical protein [Candidatus Dependentiae bacterium]